MGAENRGFLPPAAGPFLAATAALAGAALAGAAFFTGAAAFLTGAGAAFLGAGAGAGVLDTNLPNAPANGNGHVDTNSQKKKQTDKQRNTHR